MPTSRLQNIARAILDDARYIVLATADVSGEPWVSPVWFAMEPYSTLYWVSRPQARHSENIAVRPEVAIVAFDPAAAPMTGQGVYMSATASELGAGVALRQGLEAFCAEAVRQGLEPLKIEAVQGDGQLRLYQAVVLEHSILDPDHVLDVRTIVRL